MAAPPDTVIFYFFHPHTMGQYFKAANTDKHEYVCPWCIGCTAKLWEWAANPHGSIFTLLLRKSDHGGGGDCQCFDTSAVAGRWAGDRVCLIGDYDSSRLYEEMKSYRNISREVVEEWNEFIGCPDMKLEYDPCTCCTPS